MFFLKQSTAITEKIGPFLDDTDGKTAETGLTIAQADVRLSKNGGAYAQKTEATSCTHDENGEYGCPLDATDTGTLGRLKLVVFESGALPVWHEYMIVPANVWDSLFGADKLEVDMQELDGGSQSAADLKDFADAGYDPATNKVEGVKLTDTTTTNTDMVGTNSAALASVCTEARLAELAAANLPADVNTLKGYCDILDNATNGNAAIKAEVEGLAGEAMRGTDGANTTVPDAAGVAPTAAEIKTALEADGAKLDHLWEMTEDDSGVRRLTTNALEQAPSGGLNAQQTRDAMKLAPSGNSPATGSIDKHLDNIEADTNELQTDDIPSKISTHDGKLDTVDGIVDNILVDTGTTLDALIKDIPTVAEFEARSDVAGTAATPAEVAAALNTYDAPKKAEMDTAHALLATVAKQDVIDGIVDAILADTGTDGVILKAAGLNADAVDKILDEVVEGSTTLRQALRLILAVLSGKSSGGGSATLKFRDIGDTKDRVTATVDENGNRTAVNRSGS